jgi:hypothetical protein
MIETCFNRESRISDFPDASFCGREKKKEKPPERAWNSYVTFNVLIPCHVVVIHEFTQRSRRVAVKTPRWLI